MATNAEPKPERDPRTLEVGKFSDESESDAIARTLLRPTVQAAYTIQKFSGAGSKKTELMSLVKELAAQSKAVGGGDLHRAESMLIAQAHTLDSIFASLANRASLNMNDGYLDAFERYMRLALKTQGQCRATLETLAAIKNPPVVYARQANIANGPQQVNNGLPDIVTNTRTRAHAREIENQQSKLSGIGNELSSDTRTPALAGGANQAVEAVGAIDRAEVTGGQGAGIAECLQGRDAGAVAGGSAGFGGAG